MEASDVDARIRELLADGQEAAVRALLVDHLGARVHALCRAMVGRGALAEDLAHDTFERAFAGLSGFRADASIASWVLRIARNRCIDHLRSGDARYVTAIGEDLEDLSRDEPTIAESLGSLQRAERALVVLEPDDRALVLLHHVHDVPYAELAETFGANPGALRMRVARALERMRETLEREDRIAELPVDDDRRRKPSRVPRSVLWAALGLLVVGYVGIYFEVILPQREAQASLQRTLEEMQEESLLAQAALEEAQRTGASEADLQALRDQLAQSRANQTAAAAGDTASIMRSASGYSSTMSAGSLRDAGPDASRPSYSSGCMGPLCGIMR